MNYQRVNIISDICPDCFMRGFNGRCANCGYVEMENRDINVLPNGMILKNRYIIGKLCGKGGFGATYKAYDNDINEYVAIKEYLPIDWSQRDKNGHTLTNSDPTTINSYKHGLENFLQEAKILSGFLNEENIVDVRDYFEENNTAYIVMEFVSFDTISKFMNKMQRAFTYEEASEIIISIAGTLSKVHSSMLLHRDISPNNIMIKKKDDMFFVKILDFGSTRQYAKNKTMEMSIYIKTGFAPIEQYSSSGKQGPWTDVYALCATFFYMLTGKKPPNAFEVEDDNIVVTELRGYNPHIPLEICDVIAKGMKMQYRERIQNMDELIIKIRSALNMINQASMIGNTEPTDYIQSIPNKPVKKKDATPHIILTSEGKVYKWKFRYDQWITIGRMQGCDIILQDTDISRRHCMIGFDVVNNSFIVKDMSSNGTFTDYGLIGKGNQVNVTSGQNIYFTKMRKYKMELILK